MVPALELAKIDAVGQTFSAYSAQDLRPVEVDRNDPSTFQRLISQLDKSVASSDKALQGYILNDGVSTHELMINIQNAKQSMQLAVEVRNKAVEAYNKLTQMSI